MTFLPEIGGRSWPLWPVALEHIRKTLGYQHDQALSTFQTALAEGRISARGPVTSVYAEKIEPEFFRFAMLTKDGGAIDMVSIAKLSWVEVCAADILARWPPSGNMNVGKQLPIDTQASLDNPTIESTDFEDVTPDVQKDKTSAAAAPDHTSIVAQRTFVRDYINNAKANGLTPSKSGLENQWHIAGHKGKRAELHQEFDKVMGKDAPQRGRPQKNRMD